MWGSAAWQPPPLGCAPVSIGPDEYIEVQNVCPLFYVLDIYVKLINLHVKQSCMLQNCTNIMDVQ